MLPFKTASFSARRVADSPQIIEHCESERRTRRIVTFAGGLAFLLLLLRTAWTTDAAYITFRTVDNVLHGYGLRWNVANRVQTYASPLWTFIMVAGAAVTGDVYYTSIALSILLSVAVVIVIGLGLSPSAAAAVLAFSALFLSKSYVEYSTSGLEQALTHLLLVIYLATWMSASGKDGATRPTRAQAAGLTALAALLVVNRLDLALLVLPTLAATIWTSGPKQVWPAVLVGLLPLAVWEFVAIAYYGFPFPNAAYARLSAHIPTRVFLYHGGVFLFDGFSRDPLTIMVIVAAIVAPFVARGTLLPAGIALYLGYIAWAGGDFTSGRLLGAPFLCAVVHLLRVVPQEFGAQWMATMAVVWLVGFFPGRPSNFSSAEYGRGQPADTIQADHVEDDRLHSYSRTGLLTAYRGVMMPNHQSLYAGYEARRRGERILATDAAGFIGYGAGPKVYVLDRWGAGDPLIARLPADVPVEIGHHARHVPVGYLETLETGRNVIRDPAVAAFYEKLRIITEGPIWTVRRWRTILAMNLGRYDRFLADYGRIRVRVDDLAGAKPDGAPWNDEGNVVMTLQGAEVALTQPASGGRIEVSVSGNDTYTLEFFSSNRRAGAAKIVQPLTPDGSLLTHVVAAPAQPYDRIVIHPSAGDGQYSLGHLHVIPN